MNKKTQSKTSRKSNTVSVKTKKADQYNDPKHNYKQYWEGREYENAAEELAIRRLLKNRSFKNAVDVGGGYGRLCILLEEFAKKVTLAEPSKQQLDIAKDYLKGHKNIDRKLMQADDLRFKDESVDLVTMIRVMHHLPDPSLEFSEIARILNDNGVFILEIANLAHIRNRIKYMLRGKRIPIEPVDIRSPENKNKNEVEFVNHNPKKVVKQLAHAGLKVDKILSVSNLRSPGLKKVAPISAMLTVEKFLQRPLARAHFGPSVFMLVRKAK